MARKNGFVSAYSKDIEWVHLDGHNHNYRGNLVFLGSHKSFFYMAKQMKFWPIYLVQFLFFAAAGVMCAEGFKHAQQRAEEKGAIAVFITLSPRALTEIRI